MSKLEGRSLTENGRLLAALLWSIECYGDTQHVDEAPAPVPLYTSLSYQLTKNLNAANLLVDTLRRLIKEVGNG